MGIKAFLSITAIGETVTGLGLLLWPAVPLRLLLGRATPAPATRVTSRVAGAALIAIGLTSGLARADARSPVQDAVITGIVVYDALAAAVLATAGRGGILRWPVTAAHLTLAFWGGRLRADEPDAARGAQGDGTVPEPAA
jgi:hypothetical protein